MTLTALPKRYSQCFKHIVMSPPRRLSAAFLSVLQYSQLNILLCELLWEGFPHETCCWGHRSLLGVCVRFYMTLRCWMETQGLAGWLLPHQEQGASDCSFPALHGSSGKAFSHFPPEKDFKKEIWKFPARIVLLAIGRHPGNFRQMELALLVQATVPMTAGEGSTQQYIV